MPSPFGQTCWPSRFLARFLAVFFACALLGVLLGWATYKRPAPKPSPPTANVQIYLQAREIYSDGTSALVPALVTTGGRGEKPVPESDQGKVSVNPKKRTPISRQPGTRQWLLFTWGGKTDARLINPWPQSTIAYTVEFRLGRPNPAQKIL